jgi:hypothetical protein
VSGQLQAPASLPPGKDPVVPTGYEAGWAPKPFWTRWSAIAKEGRKLNILSYIHQIIPKITPCLEVQLNYACERIFRNAGQMT